MIKCLYSELTINAVSIKKFVESSQGVPKARVAKQDNWPYFNESLSSAEAPYFGLIIREAGKMRRAMRDRSSQSASRQGWRTFLYRVMRELVCNGQLWVRGVLRQFRD